MDAHNAQSGEALFVPELIDLPVHPETRTDQKTVDAVLQYLWKNRPDLVAKLAYWEKVIRDPGMHGRACADIGFYLRQEAIKEIEIPESRLGLLDVIFEVSRRVRKSQGLKEIPILGKPLTSDRNGDYPPLIDQEIQRNKEGKPYFGMSQEMADIVCSLAYRQDSQLMFDFCEQVRRSVSTPEITSGFYTLVSKIRDDQKFSPQSSFAGELHSRLNTMCRISSTAPEREI